MIKTKISLIITTFLIGVMIGTPLWNGSSIAQASNMTALNNSSYKYKFEGGYPSNVTAQLAYDNADLGRAIEAYKFFYPTISTESFMQVISPDKPNGGGVKFAAGPEHQAVLTPNSDTPYAAAVLDLKAGGPMVIDLPSGNFIGFVDDHNFRWVLDMGNTGPDKGQGGKYLILPPNYNGTVSLGYYVGKSDTWKVNFAIRSVPADGNATKALAAFDHIKVYPLSEVGKPSNFRFVDVTNQSMPSNLVKWEDNLEYWKQLKAVIDEETSPVEFRPMYGMLQSLGIEKGKPFAPDTRMTGILQNAAKNALAELKVNAFANREPNRLVWNDRNWEWTPLRQFNGTTKDMGVASYLDLQGMDNWFYQAVGAALAMGKREPGGGSLYFAGFRDNTSAYLDGSKTYRLNVPAPVPGKLFWSVTVYDVGSRSEVVTDQNKAAIGSIVDKPQANPDGSYDIYFGPNVPPVKEHQWIKTNPGKDWFAYFRIYGPEAPAFNGAWKLNDIVEIK
jgi:hypothetical protein